MIGSKTVRIGKKTVGGVAKVRFTYRLVSAILYLRYKFGGKAQWGLK